MTMARLRTFGSSWWAIQRHHLEQAISEYDLKIRRWVVMTAVAVALGFGCEAEQSDGLDGSPLEASVADIADGGAVELLDSGETSHMCPSVRDALERLCVGCTDIRLECEDLAGLELNWTSCEEAFSACLQCVDVQDCPFVEAVERPVDAPRCLTQTCNIPGSDGLQTILGCTDHEDWMPPLFCL